MQAIYGHSCPTCGGSTPAAPHGGTGADGGQESDDMRKEAARVARGLYDGTITSGTIDPALTKLVAEELRKAVIEGFGKDLPQLTYGMPDYKKLAHMEINVYQFAAAKDYQHLASLTQALHDKDGKPRSWGDFKEEAANISQEYNGRWLKTEYDSAMAGGQMAAKWAEAEKHKETAPWLRYDTAGDSRVRKTHRALDGVMKKVEDPFWNTWYPPNGWNCRCDVTQLLHGSETLGIETPDDVPPLWQVNLGKEGLAFPPGHVYYTGVPPDILKRAEEMRTPQYSQAHPLDGGKTKKGGRLFVSSKADREDKDYNVQQGTILADHGETVHIRPHVPQKKNEPVKNAELGLYNDTQTGDFKTDKGFSKTAEHFTRNSLKTAKDQGDNIPVLIFEKGRYNSGLVWRALRGELARTQKKVITEVWIMLGGELTKLTREDIAMGFFYKMP